MVYSFGKKARCFRAIMLGGPGSFKNAMDLMGINGTQRMDTGETSQGAQELAQKVQQNEKYWFNAESSWFFTLIKGVPRT